MARRRRSSYRRPGPRVWLAAIALVVAIFAFADDNPIAQGILFEMAGDMLYGSPVTSILGGGARVIDGDTLDVDGKKVRLHGIDAPESRQTCRRGFRAWACGDDAKRALERLIGVSGVKCEERSKDRYGRSVANCRVGRHDINAWMVRNGWAVAYRQYGGGAYAADEAVARIRKAGIWSSRFVMPWDWRKGKR